jgi:hypothetical protein
MIDGTNDLCKHAMVNNALEVWCSFIKPIQFIYHIDRSVDLCRPDFCCMREERVDCDQTKGG